MQSDLVPSKISPTLTARMVDVSISDIIRKRLAFPDIIRIICSYNYGLQHQHVATNNLCVARQLKEDMNTSSKLWEGYTHVILERRGDLEP